MGDSSKEVLSLAVAASAMADVSTNPAALSVVCKHWESFDLETVRGKLDGVGLRIAELQEESMQSRKRLADATREFRRTAPEPALKGVGPLLKNYQEEIDHLTRRAKHSETAFLELYQKLYEAPDPAPALAVAFETATRVAELEAQAKKMGTELAEFRAESTQIKNQDLTIRKLEEKIRLLEESLDEKEQEVEQVQAQAVADADAARVAQMQEREAQLTQMLTEAQASLANLQKLHTATQNQLFAIQSQSEEEQLGRQKELELASSELDRAQERMAALEREKSQLKQRLESNGGASAAASGAAGGPVAGGAAGGAGQQHSGSLEESLRQELHMQREVAARLRSEVAALRREAEQSGSMWEARMEGMKSTLHATEAHAQALERELSMRPTPQQVEELRQQVRVLQAVGCNTLVDDDGPGGSSSGAAGGGHSGGGADGPGGSGAGGAPGSLESLLLQKNRHLEHELTMARLRAVDSRAELDAALGQLAELERQLEAKQRLVNRLEDDLLAARGSSGSSKGPGQPGSSGRLSDILTPRAAAAAAARGDGAGEEREEKEEEAPDASMVRVLCSQRDRFRAKCVELEEEVSRLRVELSAAKNEAAAARADNVALVERLRYVHGFKAQQRGDPELGGGAGVGADVERKYSKMYEEGINPFKEFQGQQRERQKGQLHFADKAMYMLGQLIFGSQGARLATFAYLAILHLLVFATLMRMTHHSSHALYAHQQALLEHGRHDVTAMLHHEGPAVGVMGDGRLP